MITRYLNYLGWLILLVFLQVIMFNNILLFGFATPFIYIYLIFLMDSSIVSKNQLMIWAFILGLSVDIGANTLGMHTIAVVLLAFIRPTLLKVFSQSNEDINTMQPSIKTMSSGGYFKYILFGSFIHCLTLIVIEYFKVSSFLDLSMRVLFSTLLTTICIYSIEKVRN